MRQKYSSAIASLIAGAMRQHYLSKHFTSKKNRPGLYIWDLDGTLSDGRHRLHLLPKPDEAHRTEAWDAFSMAAFGDLPLSDNISLCNELAAAGYRILILTGRSDVSQDITMKWLKLHGVKYHEIIMRSKDDHRKDIEFKGQILEALLNQYPFRIHAAFDDLEHVCKFIRSLGITCYQVAHYDTPKLHEQEHK